MNKNSTFANKIPENSFNSFEEIFNNFFSLESEEFIISERSGIRGFPLILIIQLLIFLYFLSF